MKQCSARRRSMEEPSSWDPRCMLIEGHIHPRHIWKDPHDGGFGSVPRIYEQRKEHIVYAEERSSEEREGL